MKKVVVIALLFAAGAVFGQEFTFRGLSWGSTVEDIIAKEGQPDWKGSDGLFMYDNEKLFGYNASLAFHLWNQKLVAVRYKIDFSATDNVLTVYTDLLNKLALVYGQPTKETKTYYAYDYYWVVSRTKIAIRLERLSYTAIMDILYQSPEISGYGNL
jgi:hypothetical protein